MAYGSDYVRAIDRARQDFGEFYEAYTGCHFGCFDKDAIMREWIDATCVMRDGSWEYTGFISAEDVESMFRRHELED